MTASSDFEAYAQAFVDGLMDGGVRDVIICPGSRSTPLAIAFAKRAGEVKQWVLYDERSAGFFALGIAKSSSSPVAIVCTSGTAAANLFPAIAEAKLARVPIVAVTADRPPETRDFGGAQTIDQVGMFTTHVKWFQDMPLASDSHSLLLYSRRVGARASTTSRSRPSGPVHINFSFREPLMADPQSSRSDDARDGARVTVVAATPVADEEQVRQLSQRLGRISRGIIVAGPGEYSPLLRAELSNLSERLGWPILADVLSNLRQDSSLKSVVRCYEPLVRDDAFEANRPDCVLRLGGVPTSKELNSFCSGAETILLDDGDGWRDPDFEASTMILGELESSVASMNRGLPSGTIADPSWLRLWLRTDADAEAATLSLIERTEEPFEGKLFGLLSRKLMPTIPLTVVVGSSMPVRDLDYFFARGSGNIRFMANRGANGIDGVVSTAMGVSASEGDVLLILGDISFYHDMNGLLPSKLYELNATIVVVNNRGGGIFSFLPQHSLPKDLFERLFGEPHDLDFSGVRLIYGGRFERVSDWDSFDRALEASAKVKGLRVIEFMAPDRDRNLRLHREAFRTLASSAAKKEEVPG